MRHLLVLLLLWAPPVWAAEVCVTLDLTGWSPSDRNLVLNLGGYLGYQATPTEQRPSYVRPTQPRANRLCYTDPAFDVAGEITTEKMQAQRQADDDRAAQVATDRTALRASVRT